MRKYFQMVKLSDKLDYSFRWSYWSHFLPIDLLVLRTKIKKITATRLSEYKKALGLERYHNLGYDRLQKKLLQKQKTLGVC